jgi:hypothetical protein
MDNEEIDNRQAALPRPKREFGAWKDMLAGVDVDALLAIPIEWPDEYMPDDRRTGQPSPSDQS